jgi:hypothetical protein
MKELASMLADARGGPIEYAGKEVRLGYYIPVLRNQEVEAMFIKADQSCEQGFKVSVDKGKGTVEAAGKEMKIAVFWTSTAPDQFTVRCLTKNEQGVIYVQNIWRNRLTGGSDSGIRNAGLYVDMAGNTEYEFHCSSGLGPVNFEDIVFRMTLLDV